LIVIVYDILYNINVNISQFVCWNHHFFLYEP
jgi:hypothetical protein